ncbi:S1 family peptidase [Streptosporangium soli]|nr:S1 family peptidase [Streptosporangium sp. KLBMP 9127]
MTGRRALLLIVSFLLFTTGVANAETASSLAYSVRGGDAFFTATTRCTIGAAVRGGFVTAGACGRPGEATLGHNRVAQGVFRATAFPGDSMAWVTVNSNWTPRGVVNDGRGGEIAVLGSSEAPIGAPVCQSGATSGWRCGTLLRRNVTVNFPQGAVFGLIETSICSEPGDTGATLLWNGHVQGVLIGGSGNCSTGGRSYYQPINEILSRYGLTLLTS